MRTICAWCRKKMFRVDSQPVSENLISHGICEDCQDNILFQMGVELQVFLDSLGVPIVVVNEEGIVVTGNDRARRLLRKGLTEIEGFRGGEIFECAYARLPEGCGNTKHCSGCTIRRTVMHTHATGKGYLRIPATLSRYNPEATEKITFLISTERFNDLVLLRIDKIES